MNTTTREKHALANKYIENNFQLRRWFPIRYIDNTTETGAYPSVVGQHAVVIGELLSCEKRARKSRTGKYLLLKIRDRFSRSIVSVSVFQTVQERYFAFLCGKTVFASGTLSLYGSSYCLSNEVLEEFHEKLFVIRPVLSKIKGISDERRGMLLEQALKEQEEDTVPQALQRKYGVTGVNEALGKIMAPEIMDDVRQGYLRMLFDDLFYLAARLVLSKRKQEDTKQAGFSISEIPVMEKIRNNLPFTLTGDQAACVDAILEKLKEGKPVHALVQGDVGCGKTITAFLPLIAAAENGYQTAMIAPTRILAEQHFEKLQKLLSGSGIDVRFFAGPRILAADKKALADGTCKIAVGTHSLLQEGIVFSDLKLFVIDEEQKFGVKQRQMLLTKQASAGCISMTATPIPRTLASALFVGSTDVFQIREVPSGRKKIITQYDNGARRQACAGYILNRKEQIYIVCPAIGGEEEEIPDTVMTTKKAVELYRGLFPDAEVADLDGTMKAEEAEAVLSRFKSGEIQILISTTIVEVGVDVPNATLMILENAERFGLSQMHQLRGRVGRGEKQSYCLLISSKTPSENKRIDTLCRLTDGFAIAEMDLKDLRHSGDLFGEEQSGFNVYVEEMIRYEPAFKMILADAEKLPDPVLEQHVLKMTDCEVRNHKKLIRV